MDQIYLDYAATTPLDERVLNEMMPYLTHHFGNASSVTHSYGWHAKGGVNVALRRISSFLNCDPSEVVFTSGATEAINTALIGLFHQYKSKGKHFITLKTEHKAVLDTCAYLTHLGAEITYVDVGNDGLVDINDFAKVIRKDTIGIAVMWVNNETGVIQDIPAIAALAQQHQVPFFCDATQAVGKIPINFQLPGLAMMAVSGHKIYAPKGIGLLICKRKNPRIVLPPYIIGGGQQNGRRSGTLNIPAIVALGKSCALLQEEMETNNNQISLIAQSLQKSLQAKGFKANFANSPTVPHILSYQSTIKATDLIKKLPQIAFSLGSACTADNLEASHVLTACGLNETQALNSFRFSLGKMLSPQSLPYLIQTIENVQ